MVESLHSLGYFRLSLHLIFHHNLHLNHPHRHQKVQNVCQEGLDYFNLSFEHLLVLPFEFESLLRWILVNFPGAFFAIPAFQFQLPSNAIVIIFVLITSWLYYLIIIGGKITGEIQVNDTSYHRQAKALHRKHEMELIIKKLQKDQTKIPQSTRDEMMNMFQEYWNETYRFFKKAYFTSGTRWAE